MKKDNVGRGCKKKPVKKEWIEDIVRNTLTDFLDDTENLANLAVDLAEYYKKEYDDNGYLSGLENELKETEKSLENVIKAVMAGASGETINKQLNELEDRKKGLNDAIDTERSKQNMIKDEQGIQAYFDQFSKSDLLDPEQRDLVLGYFVDKIYIYDDRLVITGTLNHDGSRDPDIKIQLDKGCGKKVRLSRPVLHYQKRGTTARVVPLFWGSDTVRTLAAKLRWVSPPGTRKTLRVFRRKSLSHFQKTSYNGDGCVRPYKGCKKGYRKGKA